MVWNSLEFPHRGNLGCIQLFLFNFLDFPFSEKRLQMGNSYATCIIVVVCVGIQKWYIVTQLFSTQSELWQVLWCTVTLQMILWSGAAMYLIVISYLDDHHYLPHHYPDLSCEVMRHWNVEIFYLSLYPCYLSSPVTRKQESQNINYKKNKAARI